MFGYKKTDEASSCLCLLKTIVSAAAKLRVWETTDETEASIYEEPLSENEFFAYVGNKTS